LSEIEKAGYFWYDTFSLMLNEEVSLCLITGCMSVKGAGFFSRSIRGLSEYWKPSSVSH